jgi:hypoxanthine phosphoribosyltransferase
MPVPVEKHPRCEILSWKSVARDAKKLSDLIKNSGYNPTMVVAIARGGLVPARILCDYLHIKDLTTIKAEHWGITATPDKKAAPEDLKTAVLIHKTTSEFVPDYYVKKIIKWRWVTFPWHFWEDMVSFIKEIKADGICSEEDIYIELKKRYAIGIKINTIKEILSELQ